MDIGAWLHGLGLGQYEQPFRDNDVDAEVLSELTPDDLIGLGVVSIGHRRKLLAAIAALRQGAPLPGGRPAQAEPTPPATAITPRSLTAERRQLTVMFVDLVGSTSLSTRIDPEDLREVIRAYQDAVAGEVVRSEGHVAKFMGDGVLAYFGFPRAHEDDAERAVQAGLDIVGTVGRLRSLEGEPLAARVGIATGLVVVGDLVGSGASQEQAVVGETPNLAARLQALADPGSVVIAASTRRLVGGLFECVELGRVEAKGFAEPVRACRVLGPSAVASRFEALHTALTPLVGREKDVDLLLRNWEQAKGGKGRVVLVSGEPGVGKSRLLAEVQELLHNEPHASLRCFCSSHHQHSPLHPVTAQLEHAAGFARSDPPEVRLEKLEALLAPMPLPAEDIALLAELLSLPPDAHPASSPIAPQRKRERTFEVLLHRLESLARREPVLMVFEDIHWIDPSSRELLDLAVERAAELPIFLLVTFRPEFDPPWTGQPHVTALVLNRLGREESAALVRRTIGGAALPDDLVAEIVERTDGVPLFVEELTKAVHEAGADGTAGTLAASTLATLTIPATLHASLLARLDRLGPTVREMAQVGAAIGREFPHELLADVAGLDAVGLASALDQLTGAGLVFRRGVGADASYLFKHALVRDVAYQSLLKSKRQQLHARIAAVLDERFPGTASAEPELLARHYAEAGLAERAVLYRRRAAELAIGRSANLEAIAHCDAAEEQLRTLPPSTERLRAELEVQLAKGVAVRAGLGYSAPEAERVFLRACELCEELSERVRLVHALRGLWAFYYVAGRWQDAAGIAARIRVAAEGVRDRVALSVRWYVGGTTLLFRGEPVAALRQLRKALHFYDEGDSDEYIRHSGHDNATLIRGHLTLTQWFLGLPDQALRTSGEGLEIARRVAHPFSLAQMLAFSAVVRVLSREWDAAEELAAKAREVSTRYGLATHQALGTIAAGIATAARDDVAKGVGLIRDGLTALQGTGAGFFAPLALMHLALALRASGNIGAALATAAEAVRVARVNGELCWEAETLRIMGEVKQAAGAAETAEIEADFSAGIAIASRQKAKSFELRAAVSLARLWAEQGERHKAHDLLAPIHGWFTEGFDKPDLQEAQALLGELS